MKVPIRVMNTASRDVVGGRGVIVTEKKQPEQVKFRWDPALIQEIRAIAERTNRTINDVGETLMRWAVERSKAELEMTGTAKKHQ